MWVEWTKHLHSAKEKQDFETYVLGSKALLNRLKDIMEEKERALDRSETSIETYSIPNWEYRQAHKNGNRESLQWLKQLVDLDKQSHTKE